MAGTFLVALYVQRSTYFGRDVYAVGGQRRRGAALRRPRQPDDHRRLRDLGHARRLRAACSRPRASAPPARRSASRCSSTPRRPCCSAARASPAASAASAAPRSASSSSATLQNGLSVSGVASLLAADHHRRDPARGDPARPDPAAGSRERRPARLGALAGGAAGRARHDRGAAMSRRERGMDVYAAQFGVSPGRGGAAARRARSARASPRRRSPPPAAAPGRTQPLTRRDRSLVVVAVLAAQGGVEERLRTHVALRARRTARPPDELEALVCLARRVRRLSARVGRDGGRPRRARRSAPRRRRCA